MTPAGVIVIGVVALAASGCGGSEKRPAAAARACAPTQGEPAEVGSAHAGTPSRVRLGPGDELGATPKHRAAARRGGEPLRVSGVVRAQNCSPLAGATIHAWQTNAAGEYGPAGRCCYLAGTVRTDARGRYALDSVMPGSYEGTPPHIHMEVGHPRAAGLMPELVLDDRAGSVVTFDIVLRRRQRAMVQGTRIPERASNAAVSNTITLSATCDPRTRTLSIPVSSNGPRSPVACRIQQMNTNSPLRSSRPTPVG